MSASELFTRDNPWFTRSVAITASVFVLTAICGFLLLPYAQGELAWNDVWNAICSAAGAPTSATSSKVIQPELAQQCAICHGPTGISRADSPNLAGQYATVVYKQLVDFRSGARTNAVMSPFAANLSDADIHDLAAYYAYLPRLPAYHPPPEGTAPRIVTYGAPLRGIAPCGSCHGALDNKPGSPWLEGLSAAYMKAQLEAFAAGTRRNDISMQMRNIARKLTPEEIQQASDYYAAQPPEPVRAFR